MTGRVGLNGYPLKQVGQGGKRVFWKGYLIRAGRVRAKPDPYRPIAILNWVASTIYWRCLQCLFFCKFLWVCFADEKMMEMFYECR
jgi:hypothetical protein